jgi:tRNA U34 5-carboxymethylaminomethyl modifying GTPase MnmE/TrmE
MAVPGGPMEICFSFDTTGSMSSCIAQVKGRVQDLIQRFQADIPEIRMAVVAHGDYCDTHTYITKHIGKAGRIFVNHPIMLN